MENHGPVLRWENVNTEREAKGLLDSSYLVERARVPGGWLVIAQFKVGGSHGLAFVPDPEYKWNGGSV